MITEKDLIGQLEGFPIQVVKKMLERQVQQCNPENICIFQKHCSSDRITGGFNWDSTPEGNYFWCDVISSRNFEVFFKKYPELIKEVWIRGVKDKGKEVITELEKRGGINKTCFNGCREDLIYYIEKYTNVIRCEYSDDSCISRLLKVYTEITLPESVLEVTMEEVAKKFGVSQIKIKNK